MGTALRPRVARYPEYGVVAILCYRHDLKHMYQNHGDMSQFAYLRQKT